MRRFPRLLFATFGVLELLGLLMALTRPAYGYVDPGSGLLTIQIGGSMLAGALFMFRSKVRRLLRISPAKDDQETRPAEPGD